MVSVAKATEKLNMEQEDGLFGNHKRIRLFVKARYDKGFLATSLNLYPINANPDTPPVISLFTTGGRRYDLPEMRTKKACHYLEGRGGMKMSLITRRFKGCHQFYTVNIQDDDIFLIEVERLYPDGEEFYGAREPYFELRSIRRKTDSMEDQIEYLLQYCRIRKVFTQDTIIIDPKVQCWGNAISPNGYGHTAKQFGPTVTGGKLQMMRNKVFKYDYSGVLRYSRAYHCFDLFVGPYLQKEEKLFEYLSTYVVPQRDKNIWGITKDACADCMLDYPPTSFPDVRVTEEWGGGWKTWEN